jgi:hypothetical protein
MEPVCAGGCGSKWNQTWQEVWCPKCYNQVIQSYLTPVQFDDPPESPPRKPKPRHFIMTFVEAIFSPFGYK